MLTKNNIKTYYIYSIFKNALLVGPIIVLYLLAKGLSMTEIMILQSIFSFSIFLLEVPTGAIADRFGRKYSLSLGAIFSAIAILIYIFGNSIYIYMVAEIIFSMGFCFKSGADSALLYDSLLELNREIEFKLIFGKGQSIVYIVQAIGSVAASFLYVKNHNLPFIISFVLMLFAASTALIFKEVTIKPLKNIKGKNEKYFELIKTSFQYIIKNSKIKGIALFAIIFYMFYRTSFWFYTPFFKAVAIPEYLYGSLFFVFNIVAAIASRNVDFFMKISKPKTMVIINLLLITSFIGLGLFKTPFAVIFILFQQITRGVYHPVLNKYINKNIESHNRATILSFISLVTNLVVALAMPLSGLMLDHTNVFTSHLIYGVLLLLLTIFLNYYLKGKATISKREKFSS
ncbi:MFS transporter [Helicovermis profundi]|uniref:MFS transporter n=1 Tax=Helicovermis profundi TaxID=3065157 RepID=A0AAU9EA03_9FIRM|nr:MFS transporter [Clostridia bacterium S502]